MKLATKTILSAFGVIIVVFLGSCTEMKTDDPIETYKLWSGESPPKNIEILNGKYWQSAQIVGRSTQNEIIKKKRRIHARAAG